MGHSIETRGTKIWIGKSRGCSQQSSLTTIKCCVVYCSLKIKIGQGSENEGLNKIRNGKDKECIKKLYSQSTPYRQIM